MSGCETSQIGLAWLGCGDDVISSSTSTSIRDKVFVTAPRALPGKRRAEINGIIRSLRSRGTLGIGIKRAWM